MRSATRRCAALAKLLASQVRHTDLVARFGGEEFVLVLVQSDAEAARVVCEKLRVAVERHRVGSRSIRDWR